MTVRRRIARGGRVPSAGKAGGWRRFLGRKRPWCLIVPAVALLGVGGVLVAAPAQAQPFGVVAFLDCVEVDAATNLLTAHWGYADGNSYTSLVPPGPENFFTPVPTYQGQPLTFSPGVFHNVFQTSIDLRVVSETTWTVGGFNATASLGSTRCPATDRAPALSGTAPAATAGSSYLFVYTTAGPPAPTVSVTSGTLPPGLALTSSGILYGTPTTVGVYSFALTATNGIAPAATLAQTLTVQPAAPTLSGTAPSGTAGVDYAYTYAVSGIPAPSVSVTAGALPPGLKLTSAGLLSGVPTAAGTYTFTLSATNGPGSVATLAQTVVIDPSPAPTPAAPTLSGTAGAATAGEAYQYAYTVTGVPAPTVSVTSGALPPGLALSGAGLLYGTPTAAGTYSFTLGATNGVNPPATLAQTLVVSPTPPSVTGTAATATAGEAYVFAYTVRGIPAPTVSVTAGSLPPGLSLTPTGILSGTPTVAGTYTFTVTATNGTGTPASSSQSLTVNPSPPPTPTAPTLSGTAAAATAGQPYLFSFTVGGVPAPTVSVTAGALPAGLALTPAGVLYGTPTTAGTSTFTLTATNGVGSPATSAQTLTVAPVPVGTIVPVGGGGQVTTPGQAFPLPLAVRVADAHGNPLSGRAVTFAVTSGSATFAGAASATGTTHANGTITSPLLTAGSAPGPVVVTATVAGADGVSPAIFGESVLDPSAARADLKIALSSPATVAHGGTVTATVTVTNRGPIAATTVVTTLTPGPGLTPVSATGVGAVVTGTGVQWSEAGLAARASVTYTVTLTAASRSQVTSLATATTSTVPDSNATNNRTHNAITIT
ncbi:MAG TPA: putative Ig domain-containing protein [Kineosporiaceae bacterium]